MSEGGQASTDAASKKKKEKVDNLDQANAEIDRLRKMNDKLGGELQGKFLCDFEAAAE